MSLSSKLKSVKKPTEGRREPLWKGPCSTDDNGGITFSLLSRFFVCRDRFRVHAIDGIKPVQDFNHRIEYGSMWHGCEEAHAAGKDWEQHLRLYCQRLCIQYRSQQEQVQHWYDVCRTQFPVYLEYWAKHPDVKSRKPLLQEEVFKVYYPLPSGRTVVLRGKFDAVDLIGTGSDKGVYLYEIKSKGDIDEAALQRQLTFDLQTLLYLVALRRMEGPTLQHQIRGVRYNVIRRPLSGGKGTIKQHGPSKAKPQGESAEEFYARLGDVIREEPSYYFMRWKVIVTPMDIAKFEMQCLIPILEQLCDWYRDVTTLSSQWDTSLNWRAPYGIWNPLLEGRATEIDEYLNSGSMAGLERATTLFPELAK